MTKYLKPDIEVYEIYEEDVIMSSGLTLPEDPFDDTIEDPSQESSQETEYQEP